MWQRRMKYLSELLEWKGYHWKSGLPPAGIELFLYTCLLELLFWIWPTLCFGIIHNIPRYVGQPWNQQSPRSLLQNFTFIFFFRKMLGIGEIFKQNYTDDWIYFVLNIVFCRWTIFSILYLLQNWLCFVIIVFTFE